MSLKCLLKYGFRLLAASVLSALISCAGPSEPQLMATSCRYARYFDVRDVAGGVEVVLISPDGGASDTVKVSSPMDNIICMSSSHVAALAEIGADSLITAVSGIAYISNPSIRERHGSGNRPVFDVGYEASLDYEKILSLSPDMLVAYTVSGVEPPYLVKLRGLGIPVMILNDHLEDHPLARAEYVRLFGALTGRLQMADSLFNEVAARYEDLSSVRRDAVSSAGKVKVLLNVPYADAWYVPGGESYMSRMINDAGGEVLGAVPGRSESSVVSIEMAYALSMDADMWLNPGSFRTRSALSSAHHMFCKFGPVANGLPIYNNTLRTTPEGGNDFWESGAVRPDLVLEDLIRIFDGRSSFPVDSLNYFLPVL